MKNKKPTYNTLQNVGYMASLAWNHRKTVLLLVVIQAALTVGLNLLELFVVPGILRLVETAAPLNQLIAIVVLFALAFILVDGLLGYVKATGTWGPVFLRGTLASWYHAKFCQTSFPNVSDQNFLKKMESGIKALQNNSSAGEYIWTTLTEFTTNIIGFAIYLLLMADLDPVIILVTAAATIASYYCSKNINSWGYRHKEEEGEHLHGINYITSLSRDYKLAKDVRILNMKPWLDDVYNKSMALYKSFLMKRERIYFAADAIDAALAFLRNGIAYAYLIAMVMDGGLSAAQFLLYFSAIGGFTAWVTGIFTNITKLRQESLDICATREFLEHAEQFQFEDGAPLEPQKGKPYALELRDVTFRYPGAEKDTLSHINLSIAPGEKLAVVGLNGAGKTTLIKLLCGFIDPTEGEVLLDGQDIRQYNRRDYYRHFSAVFQNFSVLAGTIAENVAQVTKESGKLDMEWVKQCVERAGLKETAEKLPQQYETHLDRRMFDDAVDLSGGQMQRLMLARALYKSAPILVLDEPTAALDPIAESDIYQRYNQLTQGSTSVYISHRLASTRFCDRIVLIENGGILEEGTHEDLLSKGGRYAELFEIQSRYYRENRPELGEEAETTAKGEICYER